MLFVILLHIKQLFVSPSWMVKWCEVSAYRVTEIGQEVQGKASEAPLHGGTSPRSTLGCRRVILWRFSLQQEDYGSSVR